MRQDKYTFTRLLVEARRSFVAQGVSADEALLVEVASTLARLAPSYVDGDAQRWGMQSSEGGT